MKMISNNESITGSVTAPATYKIKTSESREDNPLPMKLNVIKYLNYWHFSCKV